MGLLSPKIPTLYSYDHFKHRWRGGHKTETKGNKAISMMRGKSPRSDVEMSKKLNFVATIMDLQWVLDKPVIYIC